MSGYSFRSPVQNLAEFLRSLAVPRSAYGSGGGTTSTDVDAYEWAALRAKQGGTKRLDFHDHDLRGPDGAVTVLRAMERSPAVTAITLSHNPLGDDGLRELLVGMKRLRSRDIGGQLEELNLSGCGLTDVSLHLLALHLLRPSPHPPSLKSLSLNNNQLSLGSRSSLASLPEFLGTTLSAPACSLQALTLTSNHQIDAEALVGLLSHLDLSSGPSQLSEIRASVVPLSPTCVDPLVEWLERPTGGARLQVLALNSCQLSAAGVRRIQRSVIEGRSRNLLHLELMANDVAEDDASAPSDSTPISPDEAGEDLPDWNTRFEQAMRRNRTAWLETRRAALALAAPARILFGGEPRERSPSDSPAADGSFPFLRLPVEVQVHVLRCLALLRPWAVAHLYPGSSTTSTELFSPVSEGQFLRILAHCASAATLALERRIATAGGAMPSLLSDAGTKTWKPLGSEPDPSSGWEEWFLRSTGCDRAFPPPG